MRKISYVFILFIFFNLLIFNNHPNQWSNHRAPSSDIGDHSNGLPSLSKDHLNPISYVPIQTKKLKNAKVIWLNFDLLREKGIKIPKEGLTPELEAKILDQFAFMVQSENDDPHNFSEVEKTLHADRYGGYGLGTNWGSGRAASVGEFQIKGVGQTPLIGEGQPFHHAHGGASFKESIQEAIWGEINHHELPFGSNRILAIIDSGTSTTWEDGSKESRALIVREDPLRPAHYLKAYYGAGSLETSEAERIQKNFVTLLKSFPLPKNIDRASLSNEALAKMGLEELIDRMAQQYSATNARRIYHGAISASNIDLSGKFLDFGTESALSDFGNAKILGHLRPFNDEIMDQIPQTLIPLRSMIVEQLKGNSQSIPTNLQLESLLRQKFKHYQKIEFLNLLGTPEHLNKKLITNSKFNELAETMIQIAFSSSEEFNIDKSMPNKMGKYPTNEIFNILGASVNTDSMMIDKEIGEKLPVELKKKLAELYSEYIKIVIGEVHHDGVTPSALFYYKNAQSKIRNRNLSELYRSNLHSDDILLIDQYKINNNRSTIWESIDHKITNSRITFKELSPYQVVKSSHYNQQTGEIRHLIFDAKKNSDYLKIISPIDHHEFSFYQNKILISDKAEIPVMRFTDNNWQSQNEIKGEIINNHIEFNLPVHSESERIEFVLRSSDNSTWWKNGHSNGIFEAGKHASLKHSSSGDCFHMLRFFLANSKK